MSKSNGRDDINTTYMDHINNDIMNLSLQLGNLSDTISRNASMSKAYDDATKKFEKSEKTFEDAVKMFKEIMEAYKKVLRVDYGVNATTKVNDAMDIFSKKLSETAIALGNFEKYKDRFKAGIDNFVGSGIFESMRGEERGVKKSQLYFRNTLDNEKLIDVYKDLANKTGIKIDSIQYKLWSLFQDAKQDFKKSMKQFGADLIEGLEKSKWIGGTLRDTFRLIGLLGANWMSQFGQLGRILGGAFYVAMELAGPFMVNLLLKGMGKLFIDFLPRMVGNLVMGVIGSSAAGAAGGAASGAASGVVTGLVAGGVGGAATGGALATTGATMSLVGGATTGAATVGALSGGGALATTGATMSLAGGATTGGALAAGAIPIVGQVLIALAGIALTIGALVFLWKKFAPKIEKYMEERKEDSDKSNSFMDWLRDIRPWGKGDKGGDTGGPTNAGFLKGMSDLMNSSSFGRLKIAPDGSVLNATSLSQAELKAQMEAYQKAKPEQFGRIYEVVSSKYANVKGFKNDAIMTDPTTGQVGALMYAGASADMERIRALAKAKGMSDSQIAKILYTGGWSTGASSHKKGLSVASSIGHDNPYALAYDIGLAGFSKKEQEIILASAQQAAQERAEAWGGKGAKVQDVYHEIASNGKYVLSKGYQGGSNQLIHTQLFRGYNIPMGARENVAEGKAVAYNQTADLGDILEFVDKDKYKRAHEEARKFPKDEQKAEYYKGYLKDMGVEEDPNLKGQYRRLNKETGIYEYVAQDKSGNLQWTMLSAQMSGYSNQGVNGRQY